MIIENKMGGVNNRSSGLDTLKAICAFLVVSIHAKTSLCFGEYLICVGRIAVPIFFMITGFYYSNSKDKQNKQLVKIIKLYLTGQVVYCLFDVFLKVVIPGRIIPRLSLSFIIDYFLFNQTTANSNHLWYLLALIYVLILARVFNDRISVKGKTWIMILQFIFLLSLGSYSSFFFGKALPEKCTMNYLFTGLPFFILGQLLSVQYKNMIFLVSRSRLLKICFICLFLMVSEWKIIHNTFPLAPQNVYFFTIISATTIFLYFLSSKGNFVLGFIGRNYSSIIYIVHMIVYLSLGILAGKLGISYFFSLIAPFLVFGVSLIYSIIWKRITNFLLHF